MKQYVIFNVGDYSFGVDILEIVEIIKPNKIVKVPSMPQYVEGIIDVRGTSVPVYNLAKRLEIKSKAETQKIIIVELSKFQLGFLVDDVSEILKIEDDKIEKANESIRGIKRKFIDSIARVGDDMIIILDLKSVLTIEEEEQISDMLTENN
ncbi:purine-binding chemotaxis protein CheW [Caldicellulosiruptor bescii]|uniref:CheW protein n=2 Tax=Caldicellulosiruptor bescii TaxID=31899 RepID=B9MLV5_CALBD|nr:chemotaxis protein CheW [Caldicellulosiruptor bescii]ACM61178.1 CheW protein [Caldicellulosiruptor bescii DSM 6725]PBC89009.1 purine-binding chemotaxis protein CheW [Caldicellulosiruptor bescii]PBC91509.1 purine-binding chemotaxis protein CheW [Caldicellulosiruptor bescii]PBD03078.1 purine-binding chemotaxis protein CheW [Caldicellulosiruptor bescii]PBD07307.1 purine-binding chemotaxis protein CheW [Caldicellulosiruptor bescii]